MIIEEEMFDALVGSVALYGVKIRRWKNETRLDRIKRICQVDLRTGQGNIELCLEIHLVEETKIIKLMLETIKRVIKYKKKVRKFEKKIVVE